MARRFLGGVGAAALGVVGVAGLAGVANPAVGPDQPGAPNEGTLTINKYVGSPVEEGETIGDRTPLVGVEFTATAVGINDGGRCVAVDLTKAAQWAGLEGLYDSAPDAPADPFCLTGDTYEGTTNDNGQAVLDLPVGVYFVEETDPGDNNIVSSVPNFYVQIPTPAVGGDESTGWNYNVVVNPKNQVIETEALWVWFRPF